MRRNRRIGVIVAGAALAISGAAGLAAANAGAADAASSTGSSSVTPSASSSSSASSASSSSSSGASRTDPTQAQLQQGAADFASKIASALHADQSKIAAVLAANHPTRTLTQGGQPQRPEDNQTLISALAKAAGVSTSQVQSALSQLNASR